MVYHLMVLTEMLAQLFSFHSINNNLKMESKLDVHQLMVGNENVVYIHNGILFICK